jgi:hypothetical protein
MLFGTLGAIALVAGCTTTTGTGPGTSPASDAGSSTDAHTGVLDRTWKLNYLALESDLLGAELDDTPVVRLETGGIVRGSTGCREFTGEWTQASPTGGLEGDTGIALSHVVTSTPDCVIPGSDHDQVAAALVDARILAVIDESTGVYIDRNGFLVLTGVAGFSADSPDDAGSMLNVSWYDPDNEEVDGTAGVAVTDWGLIPVETIDDSTSLSGPITGSWQLVSGGFGGHQIDPSKLLSLDSQPGRRTVWTFDGTTFTTGAGCASLSGTIHGSLGHKASAKVTSVGSCVFDTEDGTRFSYDLEADQTIASVNSTTQAAADADRLILTGDSPRQLVFERVG